MLEVREGGGRLEIASPQPWGARLVFALLALFPLLAPYELLWRAGWRDILHPFFVLPALVSAGALALSGLLFLAAIAGLSTRLTFDLARGTFAYEAWAPVIRRRPRTFPLAAVTAVAVRAHEWSDGEPSYSLAVSVAGGQTFATGSTHSRAEAEALRARVATFLKQARPSLQTDARVVD